MDSTKKFLRKNLPEILLIILAFAFSFWLMHKTFQYNSQTSTMYIASKAWSDFASHIPLIRSFSFGNNFPPEYPLFSGEPIRYHFLFYLLVGLLEKIGLPLDWALNLPSSLSLTFLLLMIYLLAKTLFQSRAVGVISVIFFLFNGSLSFWEFFKTHPLSPTTIRDIVTNIIFPSFGPYDGKIVSAFWNLNIYTNQRHLALPLGLLLALVFSLISREKRGQPLPKYLIILWGVVLGLLPFSHSSVFIMALAILGVLFILFPQRKSIFFLLLIAGLISLPRIIFLKETTHFTLHLQVGYLITNQLTLSNFLNYWFLNLGLSLLLIPLGVWLAPPLARQVFFAFFSLFLLGNLVQFSPEMAANHKFFNAFLIVGNMFSAWVIYRLWQKNLLGKTMAPILIFFLTFSGIIDFFPIKNDTFMSLADYPKNPDVAWIKDNTPKDSVFLNSSYLYHPASLAGRKIFLGWPYFAWSAGYDTNRREMLRKKFLEASSGNKNTICNVLKANNIKFVSIEKTNPEDFSPNFSFWEDNFLKVYNNPKSGFTIYDVTKSCSL